MHVHRCGKTYDFLKHNFLDNIQRLATTMISNPGKQTRGNGRGRIYGGIGEEVILMRCVFKFGTDKEDELRVPGGSEF